MPILPPPCRPRDGAATARSAGPREGRPGRPGGMRRGMVRAGAGDDPQPARLRARAGAPARPCSPPGAVSEPKPARSFRHGGCSGSRARAHARRAGAERGRGRPLEEASHHPHAPPCRRPARADRPRREPRAGGPTPDRAPAGSTRPRRPARRVPRTRARHLLPALALRERVSSTPSSRPGYRTPPLGCSSRWRPGPVAGSLSATPSARAPGAGSTPPSWSPLRAGSSANTARSTCPVIASRSPGGRSGKLE